MARFPTWMPKPMLLRVTVTAEDLRLGRRGATPVERAITRALRGAFPRRNLWCTVQADCDADIYIYKGRKKLSKPAIWGGESFGPGARLILNHTIFTGEILNPVAANHNWCWERRNSDYSRATEFEESGLLYRPFKFTQEVPVDINGEISKWRSR